MKQYSTEFDRLTVGAIFSKGGNQWKKVSTRTAKITLPKEYYGKWFYFSNNDNVVITDLNLIKS